MRKLLLTTLLLCAGLAATAYEYQFNWAQMEQNAYSNEQLVTTAPDDGIDVYINSIDGSTPFFYAWDDWNNNTKLTGAWPGTRMTQTAVSTVNGQQVKCFKIHVDNTHFKFQLNKGILNPYGDEPGKSAEVTLREAGSYFFDYDGKANTTLTQQRGFYYTPQPIQNKRIFVKNMNDENTPYVYAWTYAGTDKKENSAYPGEMMTSIGNHWYYADLPDYSYAVISEGGNDADANKTHDITINSSGSTTIWYYPSGSGQRYEPSSTGLLGATNNYKEWEFTPYMTINGNEVSFRTGTDDRYATFTIICPTPEFTRHIQIVNGELQFAGTQTQGCGFRVTVHDGSNLRQVWLGKQNQSSMNAKDLKPSNNLNYYFEGGKYNPNAKIRYATTEDVDRADGYCIKDLEGLWSGSETDHLYPVKTGTNKLEVPCDNISYPQYPWELYFFYISKNVKVYSEAITLEDLLYADGNVRLQSHKIDHPLIGVGTKVYGGKEYLIVRSAEELKDHRQTMAEGQRSYVGPDGKPYPWSDPNSPQYGWMMLDIKNPRDYVGKTIENVRGAFCNYDLQPTQDRFLMWLTPNMTVTHAEITGDAQQGYDVLNTYPLANLNLLQEPQNIRYFLLKPNLAELCNIIDVMRSHGSHYLFVPTSDAIMPEEQDANGNIVSRPNFYVENGISYGMNYSYSSLLQDEGENAYRKSDEKILGAGNLGLNWRLYDKVYDFPNSLVVAALHAADLGEYVYPLNTYNSEHTATTDNRILHVIGEGQLKEYNSDMIVGSQDYWSRYQYRDNRNAYRNDIMFTLSNPKNNGEMGKMILYRHYMDGNKEKNTAIAEITHTQVQGNVTTDKFSIVTLPAAKEAERDGDLIQATDKEPIFPNTEFTMSATSPIVLMSDMFYSSLMTSSDANTDMASQFTYKLEPAEGNDHEITTAVSEIPVYKTDVNVAGHSMYTQSQVNGDIDDHLQDDGKVKVYFTPNHATAVTRYDVLGGKVNDEGFGYAAKKSSTDLVNVDATNFMDNGIEIANAEQYKEYVPEVYTLYNDNTYGCYKEEVGNATVTMTHSKLYESTKFSGKTGEHIYFCNLDLSTVLTLVENDERYLLRVWRKVGNEPNEPKVLLNDLEEFTHEYFDMGLKIEDKDEGFTFDTEDLYTHYHDLNNWATKEAGSKQDVPSKGLVVPDMFKHKDIDETTDVTYIVKLYVQDNKVVDAAQGVAPAGAPRRAQDNPQAYYVKRVEQSVRVSGVITGVDGIHSDVAVSSVRYVNVAGQVSDKPWSGVNMVVTTLADGTTRTSKIVR